MKRSNWFYTGVANFLQSSQQGIDLQTSLGGGIGRFLMNTNRARVSLSSGLLWQGTQYREGGDNPGTQNAVASFVAGDVQAFKFKKTTLSLTAGLLPVLSQPGRVRINTNVMYSIQIINNLWWKFTFYGNWDNRPPANFSGSDYGTSSGITYTFN